MDFCSYCDGKMKVKQVAHDYDNDEVYRLRRCEKCGHEEFSVEFEVEDNESFRRYWRGLVRENRYGKNN